MFERIINSDEFDHTVYYCPNSQELSPTYFRLADEDIVFATCIIVKVCNDPISSDVMSWQTESNSEDLSKNKAVLFADLLGFASLTETNDLQLDRIKNAERPLSWDLDRWLASRPDNPLTKTFTDSTII
jgi:hypothetical protein